MAEISENSKVKYNFVGKSGLKVSNICLGTLTFGESPVGRPGQSDEIFSHQILDRFAAYGGNFIDTADIYARGTSENILGTWLERQPRENFVVATKCRFRMGLEGNKNAIGLSRRHITSAIENSLKRLRTDYVDIYQTHLFDDATPLEETLRTLDDLVRCGKIRYPGVSNVTGWQLEKIVQTQTRLELNPIVSLQQQYNLVCRESELEPFQVCKNEGIGVLPWSPLKGGLLTGKVRRDMKPTEGRVGWVAQDEKRQAQSAPAYSNLPSKVFDIIETAEAIGKKHGRSIAQVALRWLLQKDVTTSIIIGATSLAQLDQNMAVNEWSLSAEEMNQLDEVSTPDVPYPYEMVFKLNKDRVNTTVYDYFVKSLDS
ncbi:4-deoxy-l-erythro-5-hexoseulose uronic acid reductase [Plakobranchus ocellatus]|uniref:4-deoxy-l-erythro-5-hexoseulose uronic acid reductase n=1 Tax=Plakobranchus ocellatus TaxID=259542 RepID=A0AAV4BPC9_9GAST|nr:4-deoxy-l-erythro-5-hexoseulose uronic acid reductase [Plakobranchus ocellatus]